MLNGVTLDSIVIGGPAHRWFKFSMDAYMPPLHPPPYRLSRPNYQNPPPSSFLACLSPMLPAHRPPLSLAPSVSLPLARNLSLPLSLAALRPHRSQVATIDTPTMQRRAAPRGRDPRGQRSPRDRVRARRHQHTVPHLASNPPAPVVSAGGVLFLVQDVADRVGGASKFDGGGRGRPRPPPSDPARPRRIPRRARAAPPALARTSPGSRARPSAHRRALARARSKPCAQRSRFDPHAESARPWRGAGRPERPELAASRRSCASRLGCWAIRLRSP